MRPANFRRLERFSIECRKTKTKTNYLPIRLRSLSQTVVKPKPKQLSNYFRHSIENRSYGDMIEVDYLTQLSRFIGQFLTENGFVGSKY